MKKLRVWWIPQVGACEGFYVPVNSPEEGQKVLDILAAYDMFQLQNDIKPDFCNIGGLQMWNEFEKDWIDWTMETEDDFFEDLDEYCDSEYCEQKEELESFKEVLYSQIDFDNF